MDNTIIFNYRLSLNGQTLEPCQYKICCKNLIKYSFCGQQTILKFFLKNHAARNLALKDPNLKYLLHFVCIVKLKATCTLNECKNWYKY